MKLSRIIPWFVLLALSASCVTQPPTTATTPRIDGQFNDWSDSALIATDPQGDATGAFDITRVSAMSRDSTLYLRFDTGRVLNLQNGPEAEGTLQVHLGMTEGQSLTLDLRGRKAWGKQGKKFPISQLPFVSGPTYAANEFELMLDLAEFGVAQGESLSIQIGGSDTLNQPVDFVMSDAAVEPIRRSWHRHPDSDIRIVSFNTLHGGLFDPEREDAISRLLRAVDADVYCFQEERKKVGLADRLSKLLPGDWLWNVQHIRGAVVATRHELKPLDAGKHAAATIRLPGHPPIVVFSVHLKCCGFVGGEEDQKRIAETRELIAALDRIRRDFPNVGIVIAGDYNLVGSRTPVDLLEEAGFRQWILPHLIGESVVTWRGYEFPPGLLDVVTFTPGPLEAMTGFILDTAELNQEELERQEVQPQDSSFSDHLLLVTDFRSREVK